MKILKLLSRTCIDERNRDFCSHTKAEKVLYVQLPVQELNFAVSLGYEICEVLDTYYWNSGGMFIFHDFIKSCEAFKNSQDNKHVSSLIKSGKQLNLTLTLCWLQPSLLLRGCPSQSNSLESSSLAEAVAVASCP